MLGIAGRASLAMVGGQRYDIDDSYAYHNTILITRTPYTSMSHVAFVSVAPVLELTRSSLTGCLVWPCCGWVGWGNLHSHSFNEVLARRTTALMNFNRRLDCALPDSSAARAQLYGCLLPADVTVASLL